MREKLIKTTSDSKKRIDSNGWDVDRLGILLNPISIKNKSDNQLLSITREKGVIVRELDNDDNHNYIPDDLSNYKFIEEGQFGMNKMKAWQGSYGISWFNGIISPAYYVFNLSIKINPSFFHVAIRSKTYVSYFGSASDGVRIGQWDLSKVRMKNIPFLYPPLPEQTRIANFLDKKCASIDKAIAQKERLIELLEERKQIIIQEAVTKGLPPAERVKAGLSAEVKMKDSGIDWIGEIPEDWEVKKLKYVVKIKGGYAFDSSDYKDTGIQVIKIANTYMNRLSLERQPTFVDEKFTISHKEWVIQKGDILMSLTGTLGKKDYAFAILVEGNAIYMLNQRVAKINTFTKVSQQYLLNLLHSDFFLDQVYKLPSGTKQANLSNGHILNSIVIYPSRENERTTIVKFLEGTKENINRTKTLTELTIQKLKEYKATLIDSVVTGKERVMEDGRLEKETTHSQNT